MEKKIICIGGATIDYKLQTIHSLELYTSNPVTSFVTMGGVAHNVALNLACLTDQVQLQCVVGHDTNGQRLLAHAQQKGIDTRHSLVLDNAMTSHYYNILNTSGEVHIGLADMQIYDQIPLQAFTASWKCWEKENIIFADTNLSPEILRYLITLCEEKQLQLCIDPVSISKAKKLPQSLAGVFLLKPDQFETTALTGIRIHSFRDCIKAGKIILDRGVKNIIISLGKAGYALVNAECQKHFPSLPVEHVVNVSGAGDAFVAGVLFELKHHVTLEDACVTGSAAAALTIQSAHTIAETMSLANLTLQKTREKNHAGIF